MARKKRKEGDLKVETPLIVVPVEPETQMPANGQQQMVLDPPEPSLDVIRTEADAWAKRCGFVPPFMMTGPTKENFPKYGHEYVVVIQENSGKERLGTARFNDRGEATYWTVDGIVTG